MVLFTLHLREDVNEDGSLKPDALKAVAEGSRGGGDSSSAAKGGKDEAVNGDNGTLTNGTNDADDDID